MRIKNWSRCLVCEKKWLTGRLKAPYICPECEPKVEAWNIPKTKMNLVNYWRKKGKL